MEIDRPFIPGYPAVESLPLGRFLPPLPGGMIKGWLANNVPPGEWVLDPYGSNPALALEAARAGYRVLVASNNPINTFLLELLASGPTRADFQGALAEIAAVRRGDERLETYLKSLYTTECASCAQEIQAQAFLWKREEKKPFARIYRCSHCGDEGERPVTEGDKNRLSLLGSDQLHRSRALGRVSIEKDLAHARASEALSIYLPRALDFLMTFINKAEGLNTTPQRRMLLQALALLAADEGSALWPWPGSRTRPRQISTPPQFREANLWSAIETAVDHWEGYGEKVVLTRWPELPPFESGICLFPGRLKSLLPLLGEIKIPASVVVFPRPNQAYWTLCALWSGWLWGREAVLPLRSVLERRRYDWQWHANALQSSLRILRKYVPDDFSLFGVIPDLSPGFLSATLIATQSAGFHMQGITLRSEHLTAQACWDTRRVHKPGRPAAIESIAREAIQTSLQSRNEPAPYINLHSQATAAIIHQGAAAPLAAESPGEAVSLLQNTIQQVFTDSTILRRCEKETQKSESGLWCLVSGPDPQVMPLSDQIEMSVVRYLDRHPSTSLELLDAAICNQFPGMRTPPLSLLQNCLESYAEQVPQSPGYWQLKPREKPALRQQDIQQVRDQLVILGQRLKYEIDGENPLRWQDESGETAYMFFLFASSMIGRFVYSPPAIPVHKCILVLPGSRANLLAYKLQRDPQLAGAASAGWRFLKFRHVTRLGEMNDLDRTQLDTVLAMDPVSWEEPVQMRMFDLDSH
jgi:hypothetical protein